MIWPDHFPDNCPPEDAKAGNNPIYVMINENINLGTNFDSSWIRYSDKREENIKCQLCGLSVSVSIEDCERSKRRVKALRNKKILVSCFEYPVGVIKNTPLENSPKHHTWWIPSTCPDPWFYFVDYDLIG